MKKIVAFFTALVIFAGVVLGMHFYTRGRLEVPDSGFGVWTNAVKFASCDAMAANMGKNTLLVMGSSELEHGQGTPYYPAGILAGQDMDLMLVGAGYYQSLFHATALAALAPDMQNKKVVLILSPQWFRKAGVLSKAYASRFSEMNYISMLKNPSVSDASKEYLSKRSGELLSVDPTMQKRVRNYENLYVKGEGTWMDKLYVDTHTLFFTEKNQISVFSNLKLAGLTAVSGKEQKKNGEIDFAGLRMEAEKAGEQAVTNNPFYVKNEYFTKNLKPELEDVKDAGVKTGYSESPEYDDLRCFLDICKETKTTPLLVNVPVNGYWYDYIGFHEDKRNEYYDNIREIANEYGVKVADFSDREYEPYFLEDTIHLGWKGWVDVSEAIYNFAAEGAGKSQT